MRAQLVKYRIWRMALRMNPQPATFQARMSLAGNSGTADDGIDGSTSYNLNRVTSTDELTSAELAITQAAVGETTRLWIVYQVDLDQADAPQPVPLQSLTFSDGTTWIIQKVSGTAMNQAWRCLSFKAH